MTTPTASLLANGEQQFCDANGVPYAGGKVYMYIPGTTTPKTTWVDPLQATPNANPIVLDASGRAIIYGSGQYRQLLKDQFGNTIWDQLTQDLLSLVSVATVIGSAVNVAGLRALALPNAYSVAFTAGYYAVSDGGGGQYVCSSGQSAGTYTDNGFTVIVPTGGNGSAAYLLVTAPAVSAKCAGLKCDGVTDDSAAWARLGAAASGLTITLPSDSLISSSQTISGLSNAVFLGPGRIVVGGNYTALTISNPQEVIWSLGAKGPINNQQYLLAVPGTTIANAFPSSGYTIYDLIDTSASSFSAHVTASKTGTTVTVALTTDAGLNMSAGVGVVSNAITLNTNNRYVMFGTAGASGWATAAPRFYTASNTEYVPGYNLAGNGYDYLSGTASVTIKVGTGRGTNTTTLSNISGYTGASYDVSKLSIFQLVNDFASTNWASLAIAPALIFNGGSNITVKDATFANLWSAVEFISTKSLKFEGNFVNQCLAGVNLTAVAGAPITDAIIANNNFDCRFQDDSGNWQYQVVARQRPIAGNLCGQSTGISITGNNILGANCAIEIINIPNTYLVQPISCVGNNIDFANQGVSFNATFNLLVEANVITSQYGFAMGGIEAADGISNGTQIIGNRVNLSGSCSQYCAGAGAAGTNAVIASNMIWAAIPITDISSAGVTGWTVKSNKLYYSNTGIFLRNISVDIQGNDVRLQNIAGLYGFLDGITYNINTMVPVYIDTIGDTTLLASLKNNNLDIGLNGGAITNRQVLQVFDNTWSNPGGFNPAYAFLNIIYSGATSACRINIKNNFWDTPGLTFSVGAAFTIGGVPAAGGSLVCSTNYTYNSASAGNGYAQSGTGTLSVVT